MKAREKLLMAKKFLELKLSDKISQISIDLTYIKYFTFNLIIYMVLYLLGDDYIEKGSNH